MKHRVAVPIHQSSHEIGGGLPRRAGGPLRHWWLGGITWFFAAALAACGGGSNPPPFAPTLSSITVAPQTGSSTTTYTGDTLQLMATAMYSDGSTKNVTSTATWSSSNANLATVSASGLVTGVAAGQPTISVALSGTSGKENVTVDAKALVSINVSPANPTLAIGISQQFDAVGTYNDGSTGDVTSTVTWSSSVPSVATVASSGIVTSIAQGTTSITATEAVQGSTSLTVPSATGNIVLINDLTDSRIFTMANSDGSTMTFFGNRDSNGDVLAFYGIRNVAKNGSSQYFSLDSQDRITQVSSSDNSQFFFNWAPSNEVDVTAASGDGTLAVSFAIPLSQAQAASRVASRVRKNTQAAQAQTSASTVTAQVYTACSTQVPENFAVVTVTPSSFLGSDPIQAGLTSPGLYSASLPSGPSSTPIANLINSINSELAPVCGPLAEVSDTCTLLSLAVASSGNLPAAAALLTACAAVDAAEGNIGTLCSVLKQSAGILSVANSVINFLDGLNPSISVVTTLYQQASNTDETPVDGVYKEVMVNFQCPSVDHLDIYPASATIALGQAIPLAATARDSNNNILLSSGFSFAWMSADDTVATVVPASPAGAGVGTTTATGVAAGGPINITATSPSSTKPGTASISVTPTMQLFSGSVSGSGTGNCKDPTGDMLTVDYNGTMSISVSPALTKSGSFSGKWTSSGTAVLSGCTQPATGPVFAGSTGQVTGQLDASGSVSMTLTSPECTLTGSGTNNSLSGSGTCAIKGGTGNVTFTATSP
jgi:hypothetical protein